MRSEAWRLNPERMLKVAAEDLRLRSGPSGGSACIVAALVRDTQLSSVATAHEGLWPNVCFPPKADIPGEGVFETLEPPKRRAAGNPVFNTKPVFSPAQARARGTIGPPPSSSRANHKGHGRGSWGCRCGGSAAPNAEKDSSTNRCTPTVCCAAIGENPAFVLMGLGPGG